MKTGAVQIVTKHVFYDLDSRKGLGLSIASRDIGTTMLPNYPGAALGGAGAPQPGGAQAPARPPGDPQSMAQAMAAQQQMAAGKLAAVHVLNASMLGALALLFIFSASSTILSCFS